MKPFATIFAPPDICTQILDNKPLMKELRDDFGKCLVTSNKSKAYRESEKGSLTIAFVPKQSFHTMPDFFAKMANIPKCFIFTEELVYGRFLKFLKKEKTPSGNATCAVISPKYLTTELLGETVRFMRKEFP